MKKPLFGVIVLATSLALAVTASAKDKWPDLSAPTAVQGGGERDSAVIVGIDDYLVVTDVPGAAQNAKDWYRYLTKSLGVPIKNVHLLLNTEATKEMMLEHAGKAAKEVQSGGRLWFVFIGHGAPAKDRKDGVLVGADAQQSVIGLYSRSVPQKTLVNVLNKGKQGQTVMIVDACFSGKSESGALAEGLQPVIPVYKKDLAKSATILSAGQADQFAGPLPGAKRPAFSYLLLGAMRGWGDANKDGQVTGDEAIAYTRDALQTLLKGRTQTPRWSAPVETRFWPGKPARWDRTSERSSWQRVTCSSAARPRLKWTRRSSRSTAAVGG